MGKVTIVVETESLTTQELETLAHNQDWSWAYVYGKVWPESFPTVLIVPSDEG